LGVVVRAGFDAQLGVGAATAGGAEVLVKMQWFAF
jgi:hypothetical protein